MVEAAPTPSCKMSQPDLLLEFLIVAFDPPSQLGNVDELTERDVLRKRRQLLPRGSRPRDPAPGTRWQGQRKLLDRGRFVLVIAAQQLRWSPLTRPLLWRTRPCARCPYGRV